ncbi:MAG: sigma-E processing peptidase SpoIIGA [Limnochordia bacterium]|nr:sigma-E processing peptidase SpoIIGA [Bacillota bacterium]
MAYVIYLDQLIAMTMANWLFDLLLLWATREVMKIPIHRKRLFVGAGIGALYFIVERLAFYRLLPFYGLWRSPLAMFLASLLMLSAAFYPLPPTRFLTVAAYFYLIFCTAGGAGTLVANLFGSPHQPNVFLGAITSMGVILIIAELGWGLIQKQIWYHFYQIPLSIKFNNNELLITALVDSGNHLRDPISRAPVIIVEESALTSLLPEAVFEAAKSLEQGDLDAIDQIPFPWSTRLRIIPYASIGKREGMLIGLRCDEAGVMVGQDRIPLGQGLIIGLYNNRLCPEGSYRALIHPEVIHKAVLKQGASWGSAKFHSTQV